MTIEITPELLNELRLNADASPDVVLALVDEIKRLKERYDEQKLLATRMIDHAVEQKKEIEQLRSIKNELTKELSCVLQHTDLSGWSLGEQIEKSANDLLRKISKTS
jgi:hypothetical protein